MPRVQTTLSVQFRHGTSDDITERGKMTAVLDQEVNKLCATYANAEVTLLQSTNRYVTILTAVVAYNDK